MRRGMSIARRPVRPPHRSGALFARHRQCWLVQCPRRGRRNQGFFFQVGVGAGEVGALASGVNGVAVGGASAAAVKVVSAAYVWPLMSACAVTHTGSPTGRPENATATAATPSVPVLAGPYVCAAPDALQVNRAVSLTGTPTTGADVAESVIRTYTVTMPE